MMLLQIVILDMVFSLDSVITAVGMVKHISIMVVAMATLEQYSVVLWIVMILVAVAAAAFFYFKSKE